jgi:heme-degrading monooxygenase HmoA
MIVQFVKFKSGLSEPEIRQKIEERGPQFRVLPGLIQKYYVRDRSSGEWAGIYIWDSEKSMQDFRSSALARSTPEAYQVEGTPRTEIFDLVKPLRSAVKEPAIR